jgi:hypothetical protein
MKMFGWKEHLYFETNNSGDMLKLLKSFRPILRIKGKGDLKCGDEKIGNIYKVRCGDDVANAIARIFKFRENKIETNMSITENGVTKESDVTVTLSDK